jgi:3-isopropylmalate dehydrogenase
VVVRENSGGVYTGSGGITMRGPPTSGAVQEMIYSRFQVERCLRYAFDIREEEQAQDPRPGGQDQLLTYVFDLWERAFNEIGDREFPDIKREYYPRGRDVHGDGEEPGVVRRVVTENMFGDIITDLGAITQGGMGIAAGGNINPGGVVSMFETHRRFGPKYTGMNVINPLAAIAAAQMMLETLGEDRAASRMERGIVRFSSTTSSRWPQERWA